MSRTTAAIDPKRGRGQKGVLAYSTLQKEHDPHQISVTGVQKKVSGTFFFHSSCQWSRADFLAGHTWALSAVWLKNVSGRRLATLSFKSPVLSHARRAWMRLGAGLQACCAARSFAMFLLDRRGLGMDGQVLAVQKVPAE